MRLSMSMPLLRAFIISLLLVALTVTASPANSPERISWESAEMDSDLVNRVDQAVQRSMDEGNMAGCVVLVGRRAGIVFEKAYGYRSIEPEKEEMTTDTVFDMASLTKPVATATGIMILVERGQLSLDDKAAKYLPDFARNGKEDITIEQL